MAVTVFHVNLSLVQVCLGEVGQLLSGWVMRVAVGYNMAVKLILCGVCRVQVDWVTVWQLVYGFGF